MEDRDNEADRVAGREAWQSTILLGDEAPLVRAFASLAGLWCPRWLCSATGRVHDESTGCRHYDQGPCSGVCPPCPQCVGTGRRLLAAPPHPAISTSMAAAWDEVAYAERTVRDANQTDGATPLVVWVALPGRDLWRIAQRWTGKAWGAGVNRLIMIHGTPYGAVAYWEIGEGDGGGR